MMKLFIENKSMKKGFTLIELLIVVAIIGILAAIGTIMIPNLLNKSKDTVTKSNHDLVVSTIKRDIIIFELNGSVSRNTNNGTVSYSNKNSIFDCPSFQHHFLDIKSAYSNKIAKSKKQDNQVWGGNCCTYGKEGRTYVKSVAGEKKCYFATYLSNNILLEDTINWGE